MRSDHLSHLRRGPPIPDTGLERAFVEDRLATQIVGSPETVERGISDLVDATKADELMITTMVYDPADRLGSFERVAAVAPRVERSPRVPLMPR